MIRIFIFSIFFFTGIIIISLIFLPAFFLPRKVVLFGGKLMGYWTSFCLKFFLNTKIIINGRENILPNEKFFIAASHQSMFETFYLQTIFNSPVFILKKELLLIPIFGWYLKKIGSISIKRNKVTKDNLGFFQDISKIKFELNNSILISKLIDGKFPNYIQVIPKNNQKKLEIDLKLFLNSVDRVASVSLDKKDGVKFNLSKDTLDLSVNNTNSGDGKETLNVKFDHDLEISFNSRYLIDVASQLDGERVEIFFNDTGSPALIKDPGDFDSIFVVMPMKG